MGVGVAPPLSTLETQKTNVKADSELARYAYCVPVEPFESLFGGESMRPGDGVRRRTVEP